jgi:MFS superfamily sulfate permease-like transporter
LEKSLAERGLKLEFIIIDMSPVSDIDASAVHFLTDWIDDHKRRGIQTVFANPSRQVIQLFERAGIPKKVGEEFILVRTHDAVTYCQEILVERGQLGDSKLPLGKPSPGSASDNV